MVLVTVWSDSGMSSDCSSVQVSPIASGWSGNSGPNGLSSPPDVRPPTNANGSPKNGESAGTSAPSTEIGWPYWSRMMVVSGTSTRSGTVPDSRSWFDAGSPSIVLSTFSSSKTPEMCNAVVSGCGPSEMSYVSEPATVVRTSTLLGPSWEPSTPGSPSTVTSIRT